ncbi:MAG: TPM domain-containing protein [Ruminococcus sp.]|nr:TPM domain-containing protein [Ruminococcus sp.]
MRRILCTLLCLLCFAGLPFSAYAEEESTYLRIADYRAGFNTTQLDTLESELDKINDEYGVSGAIIISDVFESISEEQAMQFCQDNDILSDNCVVLTYSFSENYFNVRSLSDELNMFSEADTLKAFEGQLNEMYDQLGYGIWSAEYAYTVCESFCTELTDLSNAAANGTPLDKGYFAGFGYEFRQSLEESAADSEASSDSGYDSNGFAYYSHDNAGWINEYEDTRTTPDHRLVPRLVDEADLISDSEEADLLKKLDSLSEEHEFDIVIVTKNSIGTKSSEAYADDYFDYNGFGYGTGHDGILFLISMENRDWAISTCGKGIPYFTDRGQQYMQDKFMPYLKSGNYNKAFNTFTDLCEKFVIQAENDKPYDYGNLPREPFSLVALASASVLGLLIAFIVCTHHKRQLTSVAFKKGAADYFRPGSFNLSQKEDIFLYKNVSKVRRQSSSGGGGGRGGSSFHHSSSGRSHGGSHGHF